MSTFFKELSVNQVRAVYGFSHVCHHSHSMSDQVTCSPFSISEREKIGRGDSNLLRGMLCLPSYENGILD